MPPPPPLEVKWSVPYQFLNLIENYQNHLFKKKQTSHFSLIAAIYFAQNKTKTLVPTFHPPPLFQTSFCCVESV
jgi:hypothetical protein